MILLYTGAPEFNRTQILPELSLGGYPSASPVPNARIANVFSTITKKAVTANLSEIKMIAIKNTTGFPVTNLKIYSTTEADSIFTVKLAAVAPATDTQSNPIFESVIDSRSLPYQATLAECEGIGEAITIASLANNAYIGLWVLRSIDQTKFPALVGDPIGTPLTGDALVSALEDQELIGEQDLQITISWT